MAMPSTHSTSRATAAHAASRPRTRSRAFGRPVDRRHDARARPRDDEGRRAGREPRPAPQPGPHARAGRKIPRSARARRSVPSPSRVRQYDVGRLKPGSDYAKSFPEQRPADGARIPALTEVFDLAKRPARTMCASISRPRSRRPPAPRRRTRRLSPRRSRRLCARRASRPRQHPVVRLAYLMALKRIAPEIERVCLTAEAMTFDTIKRGGPAPRHGSPASTSTIRRLGTAPGRRRRMSGLVAALPNAKGGRDRRRESARPQGDPLDRERARGHGAPDRARRRRDHTDYPDRLRAVMAARKFRCRRRSTALIDWPLFLWLG